MKTQIIPKVHFTIHCELTEGEARALDALAGYGTDEFLKTFYEHMGKAYLEPYAEDLRDLFIKIKELGTPLAQITDARRQIKSIPGL